MVQVSDTMTYKSMMYSGIPNFVNSFGYINASWTLKADITSEYVCRLIKHMDKNNFKKCCPEIPSDVEESKDWLEDWSSGEDVQVSSGTAEASICFSGGARHANLRML